ncbi:hypothetical protein [Massilia sp. YIM B02443]|uniref:hypothetical protein n=1 Tax=Massilia sp. YIM B02443 TaxID=3050127 RepID=UPI0025B6D112|nr:hypothetical protein [Massilia sp. YIM B02443]MDN4037288.1 hypothetical protein [Massilia sp. YIM B02443]
MTWFMIRIEGEGGEVKIDGKQPVLWGLFTVKRKLGITGFYATRYVEAVDADTAIELVSLSIKNDLIESLPQSCGPWNGLVLKVDGIETVDPKDVDVNAKGFTFF